MSVIQSYNQVFHFNARMLDGTPRYGVTFKRLLVNKNTAQTVKEEDIFTLYFRTNYAARTISQKILHDLSFEYCGNRLYVITKKNNKIEYIDLLNECKLTGKTVDYIIKHLSDFISEQYGTCLSLCNTGSYYFCEDKDLIDGVQSVLKLEATQYGYDVLKDW